MVGEHNSHGFSEDELLARAVAGDHDALSALLKHYGPQIRMGLKISPKWQSVLDADDVMQVTYMEAFLRIGSFTPIGPGAFRAWLRRIAANNLRDAIKKEEAGTRPQNRIVSRPSEDSYSTLLSCLPGTITTPGHRAGRHEIQEIIESALHQLPHDYEKVLRLYYLEERSGPETAEIMGRSHGAVKMLVARALDRLGEILGSSSNFLSGSA